MFGIFWVEALCCWTIGPETPRRAVACQHSCLPFAKQLQRCSQIVACRRGDHVSWSQQDWECCGMMWLKSPVDVFGCRIDEIHSFQFWGNVLSTAQWLFGFVKGHAAATTKPFQFVRYFRELWLGKSRALRNQPWPSTTARPTVRPNGRPNCLNVAAVGLYCRRSSSEGCNNGIAERQRGTERHSTSRYKEKRERERERQRRREGESRLLWSDCNVLLKQSSKPGILFHLLQHMFCDSFHIHETHFMWLALVHVAAASHHSHPPGRGDHSCSTTSSCKDLNVDCFWTKFLVSRVLP